MNACGCDRTRGLWTIGNTSAADYWDWEEFADLFPGTLSGDLTVTQIADIVMGDEVSIVPNLNGHKLTVTSDTPHNGNPSVGWKIIQENADHRKLEFWTSGDDAGGTLEIKNLQFLHTVHWTTLHEGISVVSGTDSSNCTILVHDLLLISTDTSSKYQASIRALGLASCTFKVWNLSLIDTHLSCQRDDPTTGGGSGVCLVENVTHVMDATFAHTKEIETDWWLTHPGTTGNQWKFRSIFSTYGLTKSWTETPDIDYVCYDVAGSLTYAVHNWNIAGHSSAMLSVDPTSADFADIKPVGDFIDRGVPLVDKLIAENITCIRGRVRQPDNGAASDLTSVVMHDYLTGSLVGHFLSAGTAEQADVLSGELIWTRREGHPAYSGSVTLFAPGVSVDPAYSGPVAVLELLWLGEAGFSGPAPAIAYSIRGTIEQVAVLTGDLLHFRVSALVSSPAELSALGDVTRREEERWPGVGVHVFYLDDQSYRFLPELAEDFIGPGD